VCERLRWKKDIFWHFLLWNLTSWVGWLLWLQLRDTLWRLSNGVTNKVDWINPKKAFFLIFVTKQKRFEEVKKYYFWFFRLIETLHFNIHFKRTKVDLSNKIINNAMQCHAENLWRIGIRHLGFNSKLKVVSTYQSMIVFYPINQIIVNAC